MTNEKERDEAAFFPFLLPLSLATEHKKIERDLKHREILSRLSFFATLKAVQPHCKGSMYSTEILDCFPTHES